jgi:hypothetical protein
MLETSTVSRKCKNTPIFDKLKAPAGRLYVGMNCVLLRLSSQIVEGVPVLAKCSLVTFGACGCSTAFYSMYINVLQCRHYDTYTSKFSTSGVNYNMIYAL